MDVAAAAATLGALAQETRLLVFRRLVAAGPEGLGPGALAVALGVPPATLSFHLRTLEQAGLIRARREGRHLYYAVVVPGVRAIITYLTEDCCAGRPELCGLAQAEEACCGEEPMTAAG